MHRHPPQSLPRRILRHLWRWLATALAGVVILLALGVGVFRLVVPQVPAYRAQIEQWAEQAIGLPVEIRGLNLEWDWTGPELVLDNVRLLGPQQRIVLVSASRVEVMVSLPDLFRRPFRPTRVTLVDPVADITRDAEGNIRLAGVPLGGGERELRDWRGLLATLLDYGRAEIVSGRLRWAETGVSEQSAWLFRDIDLRVQAADREYRVEGSVGLPSRLGEKLSLSVVARGPAALPEQWEWRGSLQGEELQAQLLYSLLPVPDARLAGTLSIMLTAEGRGAVPRLAHGSLHGSNLALIDAGPALRATAENGRRIDMLHGAFAWERQAHGWELVVEGLRMRRGARTWPAARWQLERRALPGAGVRWTFAGDFLRLEDLALLESWLPAEWNPRRSLLGRLAPRGDLHDIRAELVWRDGELQQYGSTGRASGLGWEAVDPVPGVEGLDLRWALGSRGGLVQAQSAALQANFPGLFRDPLHLNRLVAEAQWQRRADGWLLHAPRIELSNTDVKTVTAALQARLPAGASPEIDLTADFSGVDLASKSRYLPVGVMGEGLVDWLDSSVLGGTAVSGELIMRGTLADFPWQQGNGLFRIHAGLRDTVLEYGEGWPRVEAIDGSLLFEGMRFAVEAERARSLGIELASARAGMADMREPWLDARAQTSTTAGQALAFLRASPLQERLSGYLEQVEIAGDLQAGVELAINVDDPDRSRATVTSRLSGGRVQPALLPEPLTGVEAQMTFTEQGMRSKGFQAHWLGMPVQGEATLQPEGTRFSFRSRSTMSALRDAFDADYLDVLGGAFDWRGSLLLPGRESAAALRLELTSDLVGLNVNLPAPFAKPAEAARFTRATVRIPAADRLDVLLESGDAQAQLRFVHKPGWQFARGRLALGQQQAAGETPPLLDENDPAGLVVQGRLAEFDLQSWRKVFARDAGTGDGAPGDGGLPRPPAWLHSADLLLLRTELLGYAFENLQLVLQRPEGGLQLSLEGPALAGTLDWPAGADAPLAVRLQRLHLPERDANAVDPGDTEPDLLANLRPGDIPAMDFAASDVQIGTLRLGRLEFVTRPGDRQLRVAPFTLEGPAFRGRGELVWENPQEREHRTRIDLELESSDVARTLSALGYAPGLSADTGRLSGTLHWRDTPFGNRLTTLGGELHLQLEDGVLREVSPGAGRFFGLLSITALPRRLLLDFSDVFTEGLSFDSISGDFVLQSGDAYTSNLRLRAPAANILMVGRIGLAARDFDQTAIVDARVSSALPVAGALAGGPQIGAVMLLLSQLLDKPLQEAARRQYRITGSWDNPVVKPVTGSTDAAQNP